MMDIERLRMAHEAASATNTHFSIRTEDGDEEAATAIREFYGLAMAAMPGLLDAASQAIPADPELTAYIEAHASKEDRRVFVSEFELTDRRDLGPLIDFVEGMATDPD